MLFSVKVQRGETDITTKYKIGLNAIQRKYNVGKTDITTKYKIGSNAIQ